MKGDYQLRKYQSKYTLKTLIKLLEGSATLVDRKVAEAKESMA